MIVDCLKVAQMIKKKQKKNDFTITQGNKGINFYKKKKKIHLITKREREREREREMREREREREK